MSAGDAVHYSWAKKDDVRRRANAFFSRFIPSLITRYTDEPLEELMIECITDGGIA
jgi:hypothetical protein